MKTFWGRYNVKSGKGKHTGSWHKVPANSKEEVIGKMLKGTRYQYHEVEVVTKDPRK